MEYFKVLVVHRQESLLEEVSAILEKFEPDLRQYSCGIDGLKAARLEQFDLILCGTDLPLITGFEMVRALRNVSRNCFTPVIFIADHLLAAEEDLSRHLNCIGIIGRRNLSANLYFILEYTTALRRGNQTTIN